MPYTSSCDYFFTQPHLEKAWEKIRGKGSPARGVDGLNYLDFDSEKEIPLLLDDLKKSDYSPVPAKQFTIKNNRHEQREVTVYTVRDKIVQQALVLLLEPLYEPYFLNCSYAYRPGKSPIMAANEVERLIREGNKWILETDIESFFDTIDHVKLLEIIQEKVGDERIIELLKQYLLTPVFDNMSIDTHQEGVRIGGILSPLLSNIYLHSLDVAATAGNYNYIRYSDDLVILGDTREGLEDALIFLERELESLHLKIKSTKTAIVHIKDGFNFLGYHFNEHGRGPAIKAVEALMQNISGVIAGARKGEDDTGATIDIVGLMGELKPIITGWLNYYGEISWYVPTDIYTYYAFVRTAADKEDISWASKLYKARNSVDELGIEICLALARAWSDVDIVEAILFECGKILSLDEKNKEAIDIVLNLLPLDGDKADKLFKLLRVTAIYPHMASALHELSEIYLGAGCHNLARSTYSRAVALSKKQEGDHIVNMPGNYRPITDIETDAVTSTDDNKMLDLEEVDANDLAAGQQSQQCFAENDIGRYDDEDISLLMEMFSGRDDIYAYENIFFDNERGFIPVKEPLSRELFRRHLQKEITLGIYLTRENQTVKMSVIDIDISKKILLEYQDDAAKKNEYIGYTHVDALRIKNVAESLGIHVHIEDSGNRGRHCWFFYSQPVRVRAARKIMKMIVDRSGETIPGITRELFPITDRVKNNQWGCLIKIPLGIHSSTGRRALFLDDAGIPFPDQLEYIRNISRTDKELVEKLLAIEAKRTESASSSTQVPSFTNNIKEKECKLLAEAPKTYIRNVAERCLLLKSLILKAEETRYLTHQERTTLLLVFGHLGDEGKDYLHRVISCCLNYDRDKTERQISRLLPKPISCNRLRETYQELTASLNCNCRFSLMPGTYPSPVLHGLQRNKKGEKNNLTIPRVVKSEIDMLSESENTDFKEVIEECLKKMVSLRKHQRGIVNSLKKCETLMGKIFDKQGIEELEVATGILTRKREGSEVRWIIEI